MQLYKQNPLEIFFLHYLPKLYIGFKKQPMPSMFKYTVEGKKIILHEGFLKASDRHCTMHDQIVDNSIFRLYTSFTCSCFSAWFVIESISLSGTKIWHAGMYSTRSSPPWFDILGHRKGIPFTHYTSPATPSPHLWRDQCDMTHSRGRPRKFT